MAEGSGFDLGSRLKSLREAHNLSQRELAKRAGVSNAIISMIEQNRSSPSVGMLKKLLDGFPLSLADFFALEAPPKPQIYFTAKELVELAGGAISYRQVGPDLSGKAMQLLHERYAPGADTGAQMLTHDAEEGGILGGKAFMDEMNKGHAETPWYDRVVYAFIRFVAPVLILLIFLNSLGVITLA